MEYYYTKQSNVRKDLNELFIEGFEFNHLKKVLRKKRGDEITVTDGNHNVYNCRIEEIRNTRILCKILNFETGIFERKTKITLYISPLRNMNRFEFAIEKAVELGVHAIYPVLLKHTLTDKNFSEIRKSRIEKIIISAMCQSQRCYLPDFGNALTIEQLIRRTEREKNKIVMYEFSDDEEISNSDICSSGEASLLIGPEGGFSENEISTLKENGWKVKSLGKRKIRAETAAIVSLFKILELKS